MIYPDTTFSIPPIWPVDSQNDALASDKDSIVNREFVSSTILQLGLFVNKLNHVNKMIHHVSLDNGLAMFFSRASWTMSPHFNRWQMRFRWLERWVCIWRCANVWVSFGSFPPFLRTPSFQIGSWSQSFRAYAALDGAAILHGNIQRMLLLRHFTKQWFTYVNYAKNKKKEIEPHFSWMSWLVSLVLTWFVVWMHVECKWT
jgi:hypothetical protein